MQWEWIVGDVVKYELEESEVFRSIVEVESKDAYR